jgi:hypothetical protein
VEIVYDLLVVLHLVAMAIVVGGWLAVVREPRWLPGLWHGALTQLVTGVLLVGLAESGAVDTEVDRLKITVKLVVSLAVVGIVLAGRNRGARPALLHVAGGLALLNVCVAVLW